MGDSGVMKVAGEDDSRGVNADDGPLICHVRAIVLDGGTSSISL